MIQLPPMTEAEVRVIAAHLELGSLLFDRLCNDHGSAYAKVRCAVQGALGDAERPRLAEAPRPRLELVR